MVWGMQTLMILEWHKKLRQHGNDTNGRQFSYLTVTLWGRRPCCVPGQLQQ